MFQELLIGSSESILEEVNTHVVNEVIQVKNTCSHVHLSRFEETSVLSKQRT